MTIVVVFGLMVLATIPVVQAKPLGYAFTRIASLGDPAPGGGNFTFDFEPYAINNRGEVAFGADLETGGEFIGEGIFLARKGQILQINRSSQDAPGGGIFALSS